MEKQQLVYGLRPVIEAIESGRQIDRILMQNGLGGPLAGDLKGKIRDHGIPFQYVPVEKLNRLAPGNHQGAVALISSIAYQDFTTLVENLMQQEVNPLLLMLDHITDVRNMGAIARTAECAGFHAIIIPDRGSAALNTDAVKTSSGALLRIPVCREANFKTTLNLAKQYGIQIVAATEKGGVHYRQVDFRQPTLLILGNEEHGISNELLKMSDLRAKLPILGQVQSLNVGVAAGIFMYEALEQRL